MLCSRCFRLIRGSPSPLLMPRYFGSHLHLLSLYFATKMHAEQFRAIIANLPLHQLCKYLCEKAQEDGSEVYGTLLWVPEEGRLALLDCLTASLESPPLTPRSAAGGDTAADAAGSSSPLQADAAGGSSTLPAASGSSSTLPSAGPASSADTGASLWQGCGGPSFARSFDAGLCGCSTGCHRPSFAGPRAGHYAGSFAVGGGQPLPSTPAPLPQPHGLLL